MAPNMGDYSHLGAEWISSLWYGWSLSTEEIFQVHCQNRPVENLQVVDFRSQPRKMPIP